MNLLTIDNSYDLQELIKNRPQEIQKEIESNFLGMIRMICLATKKDPETNCPIRSDIQERKILLLTNLWLKLTRHEAEISDFLSLVWLHRKKINFFRIYNFLKSHINLEPLYYYWLQTPFLDSEQEELFFLDEETHKWLIRYLLEAKEERSEELIRVEPTFNSARINRLLTYWLKEDYPLTELIYDRILLREKDISLVQLLLSKVEQETNFYPWLIKHFELISNKKFKTLIWLQVWSDYPQSEIDHLLAKEDLKPTGFLYALATQLTSDKASQRLFFQPYPLEDLPVKFFFSLPWLQLMLASIHRKSCLDFLFSLRSKFGTWKGWVIDSQVWFFPVLLILESTSYLEFEEFFSFLISQPEILDRLTGRKEVQALTSACLKKKFSLKPILASEPLRISFFLRADFLDLVILHGDISNLKLLLSYEPRYYNYVFSQLNFYQKIQFLLDSNQFVNQTDRFVNRSRIDPKMKLIGPPV